MHDDMAFRSYVASDFHQKRKQIRLTLPDRVKNMKHNAAIYLTYYVN